MKEKKRIITGFILGTIFSLIISGITVFASIALSKDITFIPKSSKWNVNNVQDAIDDLYTKAEATYCVTGTIVCDETCGNDVGYELLSWTPSKFVVRGIDTYGYNVFIYNNTVDTGVNNYHTGGIAPPLLIEQFIRDGKFVINNIGSNWNGVTTDYIACK